VIALKKTAEQAFTPMMQQYLEIKKDYSEFIVFFRLGDFYEMFFEDAILASKELEIVLTGRDAGQTERVPMCGVPYHAANLYLERLIEKNYKVAIVEQVEDPKLAKDLVRREVIRLVTPGTAIEDAMLDGKSNNYIASITETKAQYLLAYADLSTGETAVVVMPRDIDLLTTEIATLDVKELVLARSFPIKKLKPHLDTAHLVVSLHDEAELSALQKPLAADLYDKDMQETFGRLVSYLTRSQRRELLHLQKVRVFESSGYLRIDFDSIRHLELIETARFQTRKGSLFGLLDRCVTAMGSRYLKQSLLRPLIDRKRILDRYAFLEAAGEQFTVREDLREALSDVYDLERILGRVSFGNANAKDLQQLSRSLLAFPRIRGSLQSLRVPLSSALGEAIGPFDALADTIRKAIVDNPPFSITEGGIIRPGYSERLDAIKGSATLGRDWLSDFEEKEQRRTGIRKLRVGYNRVFGYYIEITKGQLDLVKDEFGYERKQTLANSERYVTPELRDMEKQILGSEEEAIRLEYDLFVALREEVKEHIEALQKAARAIAEADMLLALSKTAAELRYVRPEIVEERRFEIHGGRHPVVESRMEAGRFVENDLFMDARTNILLITGPNMSGKSTYMRQIALIVVMAQIGSFVPAQAARLPIVDQIFTRIGASDDLSMGQSTFMVEMLEVNRALKNATEQSLILFDEIGRGTATYDGMALAQAIIEYAHHKLKSKILFSTHYHELTYLEDELPSLHNVHVMAREEAGSIVFLHKVADGPTDRSYGIHVAKLAQLPKPVIRRADEILLALEQNHGYNVIKPQTIDLFNFDVVEEEPATLNQTSILDQLKALDVANMTPLQAMNILFDVVNQLKE
jgi:DNA mismatch repair protein MutS